MPDTILKTGQRVRIREWEFTYLVTILRRAKVSRYGRERGVLKYAYLAQASTGERWWISWCNTLDAWAKCRAFSDKTTKRVPATPWNGTSVE